MIKAIAIFFGLFFLLMALLFWAKSGPGTAQPAVSLDRHPPVMQS